MAQSQQCHAILRICKFSRARNRDLSLPWGMHNLTVAHVVLVIDRIKQLSCKTVGMYYVSLSNYIKFQ